MLPIPLEAKLKLAGVAVVAVAVASSWPATAQTLYRCGNTFSQTPCTKDALPTQLRSSAAPERPETPSGKDLCIAEASKALGFNETQPELFEKVAKAPAEVIQYAGTPIAAKAYVLQSRDRVHQGILVPAFSVVCHLSDDEQRLLRLGPAKKSAANR